MGIPGGASGNESVCQAGDTRWEDSLEKEMGTSSSILAWETLRTEELGGLQSMGPQRVRHD